MTAEPRLANVAHDQRPQAPRQRLARQRLAERAREHGWKQGEDRAGEHRATLSALARSLSRPNLPELDLQDRVEIEIRARRILTDPHRLVVGKMIGGYRQVVRR